MRKLVPYLIVIATSIAAWSQTGGATGAQTTFPRVVKTFYLCDLTDALPATTVFTPTKTGVYRITLLIEVTQGNGQGFSAWQVTIGWDNGYHGGKSLSWDAPVQVTESTFVEQTDRVMVDKPITISSSSLGDVSGTKYGVKVIVEQLM